MITIDYQSRKPIYEQIVEKFQLLIVKGVLLPDSQMPSVRALAVELAINPNTIQKAYAMLEQQGYIYPVKGRGNFVTDNQDVLQQKRQEFFENLRDLIKKGKDMGISKKACISYMEENWKEGLDL
ncbi:GntR family transcriptional regulator [Lachnoclostridium sp. An181]|uniref:GntR family transcriptional regulator n=1 Tax=Lachnoclostridium sp. An181 TaxID=1965575 RepID=UPI000B37D54D|nr:GntR family transcriptional regulator [Lachnoclostridium sp. An181]OUP51329.1 GntR family transcriptional regulator [Lachnoclostridium sp. An181]